MTKYADGAREAITEAMTQDAYGRIHDGLGWEETIVYLEDKYKIKTMMANAAYDNAIMTIRNDPATMWEGEAK
jgi:hypothetical protein